jgi:hypothetical protein
MKYSFSNWEKRSGTIPVTWTEDDYTTNTSWRTHGDKNKGFTAYGNAHDIYNNNIGVLIPNNLLDVFDVRTYFDLENQVFDLSKYTPGMILPWHQDDYPTYSKNMAVNDINNIVRIIVFLHNPAPGHQLWINDRLCNGPAGSWYAWTGTTKHMAANLGEIDRYVIQITGTIK